MKEYERYRLVRLHSAMAVLAAGMFLACFCLRPAGCLFRPDSIILFILP